MAPIRAIAYEEEPMEDGGLPLMLCFTVEEKHLYPTSFLRNFVATLEEDEDMDAAYMTLLLNELKWFLAVRKHWTSFLHFIDRA